ncbi:MAG: sigma-E processing peptidase SpoIIGA [Clostridia bacterium]|nr:sigma-E processing peptidase SpoIIGA [Clostridia bacterium]
MEKTVYADILFFVNFCMDFQCLFLTAKLLRRPFPLWKSVLAAALGALYACVALFLRAAGLLAFLADALVCLLMCVIVFLSGAGDLRRLPAPFLLYFGVSFAVGGVMSGLASLLSHIYLPIGEQGETLSGGAFFFLAALGGLSTFLWGRFCQRRAKGARALLHISLAEREKTFSCLVDTANLLHDPVGGRAVAILSPRAAVGVLPDALLAVAGRGDPAGLAALPYELAARVRLIPAETVTGSGVLFAISPDRAVLDAGRGGVEVELLLAPSPLVNADDYDVLLPAELVVE